MTALLARAALSLQHRKLVGADAMLKAGSQEVRQVVGLSDNGGCERCCPVGVER